MYYRRKRYWQLTTTSQTMFSRVLNKLPNFLYEEELPGVKQ